MTVRLINEISETTRITFCSACGNQESVRHVDFDAACDRGYGKAEGVQIALDDLILCEGCLKRGATILGIEDSTFLKADNEELKQKLDIETRGREKAERYIDTLEEAFDQRSAPVKIDHRKRPRERQVA
jgi:hypothetical protein